MAVRQVGQRGPGALLSTGLPRWTVAAAAAVLVLAAACETRAPQSGAPDPAGAPARLAARLLGPTPAVDDLRHLCDRIGGRPTGGAACEQAVNWFLERFRAAGVDLAWAEKFPVPNRWQDDRTVASVTAPAGFPVRAVAMPFGAPTPKGGIEAEGSGLARESRRISSGSGAG